MKISVSRLALVLSVAGVLAACSNSTPTTGGGNVQYGDAKAVETLTNEFGSTDLQTIAEAMSRSLAQTAAGYPSRPLVTLADVKNRTSEYIDTRSITETIRTQLLKSGTMRFATDIAEMNAQTDELARQNSSGLYKSSTTAKTGKMEGAKYRIEGAISSIVKRKDGNKDVYYKFSLIMTDIQAGTIEWADEKEIRKTSSN